MTNPRYAMRVETNTPIPMRDGAQLRANVYRPDADGRFPVLMTFGPYGKDVPLRQFMQEACEATKGGMAAIILATAAFSAGDADSLISCLPC